MRLVVNTRPHGWPSRAIYRYHNLYDDLLPVVHLMEQHNLWNTTNASDRIIVFLNPLVDRKHNAVFVDLLSLHFGTVILSEQHWWLWLTKHLHPSNNESSDSMFAHFEHALLVPTALKGSGQVLRHQPTAFESVRGTGWLVFLQLVAG